VWSGVHTRLGAKIIDKYKQVDGLIVWDWLCGSKARPRPKLPALPGQPQTTVAQYQLPPPCVYLFPKTVASVKNSPKPPIHNLEEINFLAALDKCFGGFASELNRVSFEVAYKGSSMVRSSSIE